MKIPIENKQNLLFQYGEFEENETWKINKGVVVVVRIALVCCP
jgi:hypothetical protein